MKRRITLALLVTGMISTGCAESLPQGAQPASAATLTNADVNAAADLAPNPYLAEPTEATPWMTEDELFFTRRPMPMPLPEELAVPEAPPARTWGQPSKADLPDYL